MKNLERDDNDYADNDEEYKVPENQLKITYKPKPVCQAQWQASAQSVQNEMSRKENSLDSEVNRSRSALTRASLQTLNTSPHLFDGMMFELIPAQCDICLL